MRTQDYSKGQQHFLRIQETREKTAHLRNTDQINQQVCSCTDNNTCPHPTDRTSFKEQAEGLSVHISIGKS